MNYYNEYDQKAAAWLRELIKQGLIPDGVVDTRSIVDVQPSDLSGYVQCHFFAGIGGWSYALQLAGWSADRPVWTGSCPCQPFSSAGAQLGFADPRHLWPHLYRLIGKRHPPVVFGEQVASKLGREWLAGVRTDLEGVGYAVGAADLCAASVGSPQIRQRIYWVACADGGECRGVTDGERCLCHGPTTGRQQSDGLVESRCESCSGGLGNTGSPRLEIKRSQSGAPRQTDGAFKGETSKRAGSSVSAWDSFDPLPCADGRERRVESGTFPLAHGVPARVGRLRGYGNAIVPQVAAAFIQASEESRVRLDLI